MEFYTIELTMMLALLLALVLLGALDWLVKVWWRHRAKPEILPRPDRTAERTCYKESTHG